MKLRNTFATVLAAAAGVMGVAAAPAMAAAPATPAFGGVSSVSAPAAAASAHQAAAPSTTAHPVTATAATAHAATTAGATTPVLTTTFSSTSLRYGGTLQGTVHLGPTATNRTVTVYAKNWGNGATFVAATGKVNSAGNFTFTYWESQTRTWWASFGGDASDNGVVTRGVAVHVGSMTSGSFTGNYATSGGWKEFHASSVPTLVGTVTPNATGQNITVVAQYYNGSTWLAANAAQSFPVQAGSKYGIQFTKWPTGYKYRTEVNYGGDLANSGSSTGWEYWTITN